MNSTLDTPPLIPSCILSRPVVPTGFCYLDVACAIATILVCAASIANIARLFYTAWRNARSTRRQAGVSSSTAWETWLFLLFAGISFAIIVWLRKDMSDPLTLLHKAMEKDQTVDRSRMP